MGRSPAQHRAEGGGGGPAAGAGRETSREAGPGRTDGSPAAPQAWRGTLARWRCRRLRAVYTIMRWFRRHKVRAHLAELQRRFQAARQPPHYGRDLVWPPPPAVLQPFQDTCQALFCRCEPAATAPSTFPARLAPTEHPHQPSAPHKPHFISRKTRGCA